MDSQGKTEGTDTEEVLQAEKPNLSNIQAVGMIFETVGVMTLCKAAHSYITLAIMGSGSIKGPFPNIRLIAMFGFICMAIGLLLVYSGGSV